MKKRTRIITVSNCKGGTSKTTTCHCIGAGLRARGYKTLFIDLDSQANLSYILGAESRPFTAMELLTGTAKAEDVIQHTAEGDVVPASPTLSIAGNVLTETGREYRLREAIAPIEKGYDFILVDTSPALTILTINAFVLSNSIIIPTEASTLGLQGIGGMGQSIDTVKKYCNPALKIEGILLTRYNKRATHSKDIAEMTAQTASLLGTKVFDTTIRECIAIREAQTARTNIFDYAPKSNAAKDYNNLIEEILG